MKIIIDLVKNWTLPLAILLGALGFPLWKHFGFFVPYFFHYAASHVLQNTGVRTQIQLIPFPGW